MPLISNGNNKYKSELPSGELIEVGSATNSFTPLMRFNKWNLESFVELNLIGGGNVAKFNSSSISNGVVTAENNYFILTYKTVGLKPPYNDVDGLDYTITLKQKPSLNTITFTYNHQSCNAYLQPPLTQAEIDAGLERPDYVVNSIAFYHDTKGGIVKAGEPYKTGKIGHLYRMRVTDANNNQTWADWGFGGGQSQITLTIDQTYLNNAVFPVVIAPVGDTFGFTSAGGSGCGTVGYIRQGRFQIPADGTGVSITAFIAVVTTDGTVQCNVYDDGTGEADLTTNLFTDGVTESRLIAQTDDATHDYVFNFSSAPTFVTSTYYRLAILSSSVNYVQLSFDSGITGADAYYEASATYTDPSNTANADEWKLSIYCTYTAGGGLTVPTAGLLAVSNITATTARLNGEITDDGGAVCQARFRYRIKP
jgi:hypothetical protein